MTLYLRQIKQLFNQLSKKRWNTIVSELRKWGKRHNAMNISCSFSVRKPIRVLTPAAYF